MNQESKTTTENRRLTRAEARVELARRTGWTNPEFKGEILQDAWLDPFGRMKDALPDFFTSRDAVAELVIWFAHPETPVSISNRFNEGIRSLAIDAAAGNDITVGALLLTPKQIALTACEAVGIELEADYGSGLRN